MTALTTMFNFIIVYVRYFVCSIVGGWFQVSDFSNDEQRVMARQIILQLTDGLYNNGIMFSSKPILILIIGVIVIGAIIGLARRLIRG